MVRGTKRRPNSPRRVQALSGAHAQPWSDRAASQRGSAYSAALPVIGRSYAEGSCSRVRSRGAIAAGISSLSTLGSPRRSATVRATRNHKW